MRTEPTTPIDRCVERWHAFVDDPRPELLDALLHDDVVFWSPIVFRPQEGKAVTTLYLTAAGNTLGGNPSTSAAAVEGDGRFRYVRDVRQGRHAVLEFETTLEGTYVDGVDMITCDDAGRIVDFKVMLRPLQAVNAVHEAMRRMLEQLSD